MVATVSFENAPRRRQAETRAAMFRGEEGLEQPFASLRGNPRSLVDNAQLVPASGCPSADANRAMSLHRLGAIDHQIEDHQLELLEIRDDRLGVHRDVNHNLAEPWIFTKERDGVLNQAGGRKGLENRLVRPRELQQVVHDLVQRVDALDHFDNDAVLCGRLGETASEDLHRASDAGQRIAHFMRDHGGHLSELHESRLLAQRRLGPLPLGDVVANRDVLMRPAIVPEKRDDGRIDPIQRAVLGAVADLSAPDMAVGDGAVHVFEELDGVQA